jgi:hypothetical protein
VKGEGPLFELDFNGKVFGKKADKQKVAIALLTPLH